MPRPKLTQRSGRRVAALALSLGAAAGSVLVAAPAHAAANVTIDAGGKGAVIDSTYSTTLTVKGSGFQSIKKGHGGIYVWFGTVNGKWKPTQGGQSGVNYVYVPDKETKENAGFQRYVAFPGSNTASAANGGTLSASGSFTTQLIIPGPTFEAVGRNGKTTTVDCRKVTCGVITIGAHGVRNGNNETFTPVKLADVGGSASSGSASSGSASNGSDTPAGGSAGSEPTPGSTGKKPSAISKAPAAMAVDHSAATAGRALSFTVQNLVPGEQFTVVLDDGVVGAGPFAAGDDGRAAGVVGLPTTLAAGTHSLRLFGSSKEAQVRFGVQAAAASTEEASASVTPARIAAGLGAAVFLMALGVTATRIVRSRRAAA